MKITNNNHIDITLDKHPTLVTDCDGRHRGKDHIAIVIENVSEYDSDLMPEDDTLVISLSDKDALRLIRQLAICVGKNVDEEFKKFYPDVAPF